MHNFLLSIIQQITCLEVYLIAMLYIYVSKEILKAWQFKRQNYSELKGLLCLSY